jgi:hypothetical protein
VRLGYARRTRRAEDGQVAQRLPEVGCALDDLREVQVVAARVVCQEAARRDTTRQRREEGAQFSQRTRGALERRRRARSALRIVWRRRTRPQRAPRRTRETSSAGTGVKKASRDLMDDRRPPFGGAPPSKSCTFIGSTGVVSSGLASAAAGDPTGVMLVGGATLSVLLEPQPIGLTHQASSALRGKNRTFSWEPELLRQPTSPKADAMRCGLKVDAFGK